MQRRTFLAGVTLVSAPTGLVGSSRTREEQTNLVVRAYWNGDTGNFGYISDADHRTFDDRAAWSTAARRSAKQHNSTVITQLFDCELKAVIAGREAWSTNWTHATGLKVVINRLAAVVPAYQLLVTHDDEDWETELDYRSRSRHALIMACHQLLDELEYSLRQTSSSRS